MRMIKSKTLALIIISILSTALATSMFFVSAHTPAWQVPTYMYVSVSPNPIGVGQEAYINLWLNTPPPSATVQYGDLWHNMTVTITSPDGTNKTLGPLTSDSSGGTVARFTPTKTGNYTFQSFFPGQTLAGDNPVPGAASNPAVGDYYQPSSSVKFTLTVQQDAVNYPSENPIPAEYWTRPIYAENNNWNTISGNWLGAGMYNATGNYNPYTTAPTTAHILWTKPEAFGGLIGGEYGNSETSNYYSTPQYEVKFTPIILNGILYYTQYPGSNTYPAGMTAVDLHTGETLWTTSQPLTAPGTFNPVSVASAGPSTVLKMGQILNFISPNQYGGEAYLWSTGTPAVVAAVTNIVAGTTTYNLFDAMTGNYILSVVNGSAFSALTSDNNGNLIGYYVNSSKVNAFNAPTLNVWNSTYGIMNYGLRTGQLSALTGTMSAWTWRPPQGAVIPFSDGIQWSVPLATNITGNPITLSYAGTSSGVVLMTQYSTTGGSTAFQDGWIIEAGYSATEGKLLWGPVNRTEAQGTRISFGATGNGNAGSAFGNGVWVECDLNTMKITGYNLLTGALLWGPIDLPNPNPYTSLGLQQIVANDSIYIWTYGGDVYSFNLFTGLLNWQYHTPSGGIDSPYGVEPLWTSNGRGVVAGGLLILPEGHEFSPPLFHGANQLAFNITTGEIVWEINAFTVNGIKAVSDGVLTALNAYDNQIYAFGMGPSKVTINAPNVGITTATSITITGTVTDISAGSLQQAVAANYPNGLPAVSDASMTPWMEHIYMQQPLPTNITGVPINIMVVDSNGNFRSIGTTTSNIDGAFSLQWTPDITGKYTVYAEFAGSQSYYPSHAVTAFSVDEVAPTPSPTQAPLQSTADMYFVPAIAGLFVLMIVIGIVLALLMLRKRP